MNSRNNQIGIAIGTVVLVLGRLAFGQVVESNHMLAGWAFDRPGDAAPAEVAIPR